MIRIENLSKTFAQSNTSVDALKNVNIHIEKGDIFGIIGISGAGKSTLLRCLSALETPTSGDIKIDGVSIVGAKSSRLLQVRRNMGVVFQGYNLLMQKTVYDNVAFPLKISHGYFKAGTETCKFLYGVQTLYGDLVKHLVSSERKVSIGLSC